MFTSMAMHWTEGLSLFQIMYEIWFLDFKYDFSDIFKSLKCMGLADW